VQPRPFNGLILAGRIRSCGPRLVGAVTVGPTLSRMAEMPLRVPLPKRGPKAAAAPLTAPALASGKPLALGRPASGPRKPLGLR
jgi:hypothetical protein